MPKKQRPSEGESTALTPETFTPQVAPSTTSDWYGGAHQLPTDIEPPQRVTVRTADILAYARGETAHALVPLVHGHGISTAFTAGKKWVAYRVSNAGHLDVLTPKRADGRLEGESKHSALARMMDAVQGEYA